MIISITSLNNDVWRFQIMRKFITVLSVCSATACAGMSDTPSYSTDLQKWVGRSEYQLYNAWGEPENEFFVEPDKKVVTYIQTSSSGSPDFYENQLYYQGMGNNDGVFGDWFGPPKEAQSDFYYCKTSFVIQDNMIIDYNFNGDYCGG